MVASLRCTFAAATAMALTGCGVNRDLARAALDRHDLQEARRIVNDGLDTPQSELPARTDGQMGRGLLERAIVRAAQQDFAGAVVDLGAADKGLDQSDMIRNTRTRQLATPDALRYQYLRGWAQAMNVPVGLKFYERLMLNPLAALFRMQIGDDGGACVEARRFGVMSDWTATIAPGKAASVRQFGELVSAVACTGPSAEELACSSLTKTGSLAAFAADSSLARRCRGETPLAESEIWVVVPYGRVSHPFQEKVQAPVTLVGASETSNTPGASVTVDGVETAPKIALDVEAAVHEDYEEALHAIKVTVFGQSSVTGSWSPWAWEFLPAHVAIAILPVAAGAHAIEIHARSETFRRKVETRAGERKVVVAVVPW
jgi:hypothetical protein